MLALKIAPQIKAKYQYSKKKQRFSPKGGDKLYFVPKTKLPIWLRDPLTAGGKIATKNKGSPQSANSLTDH
jgi:hypothetical protein